MKTILVINAGSTSLKFKLFENESLVLYGMYENFESEKYVFKNYTENSRQEISKTQYDSSLREIAELIDYRKVDCIAFRIVHGGGEYSDVTEVNSENIHEIEKFNSLAPLHNPPAIAKIKESFEVFPNIPKYAFFDTAFFHQLPEKAYLYGIPYKFFRENGIRKYGFHGISHQYLSEEVSKLLGSPENSKVISCHLGGGASISAIKDGICVDTSMGFTPLEGLIMSTRAGDTDDGVQNYLEEKLGYTEEEINHIFNYESGLKGLSELSGNMLELLDQYHENEAARRAIDTYVYRIQKYIGSYYASMNGLDAIVFSGGVGSGSFVIRKMICQNMDKLGIIINDEINDGKVDVTEQLEIGKGNVRIFTMPTNEELMIVRNLRKSFI